MIIKNKIELKQHLLNECCQFIDHRHQSIKSTINDIQESLDSETKSSAGDKHETGRAMLQIELEKAGNQLNEIQKIKDVLNKIDFEKASETVCLGSVVFTSASNYYIAISAGELKLRDETVYAISANTPIGLQLIGKQAGDTIAFRDTEFTITKVI